MKPFKRESYIRDYAEDHANGPFCALMEHYPECSILHTCDVGLRFKRGRLYGDRKLGWAVVVTGQYKESNDTSQR